MTTVREWFMDAAERNGWLKESQEDNMYKVATNFLLYGTPIDVVAKSTGLDESIVKQLKSKLDTDMYSTQH